jgi:hypothetical protein
VFCLSPGATAGDARGRGSAGRASPCQGEGRGFESRRPLGEVLPKGLTRWSGREARQRPAKPCTRVQIPSPPLKHSASRAISSVGERYLDTVEVTGSIPVSPTRYPQLRPCVWSGDLSFSRGWALHGSKSGADCSTGPRTRPTRGLWSPGSSAPDRAGSPAFLRVVVMPGGVRW